MAGEMVPGETMGDWKVVRILGKGSYGTVGLIQNLKTNEKRALKKYQMSSIPSGSHEAKKLRNKGEVERMYKKIVHPNIVSTREVPQAVREYYERRHIGNEVPSAPAEDEADSTCHSSLPLLAMEYCSGGNLRQMLRRPENVNGLSEKDVRLVLLHISKAITYLHNSQIVHRDIKPENIVIQYGGSYEPAIYKLVDLGSAWDSIEKKVLGAAPEVSEAARQVTYKIVDFGLAKDLPPTGNTCSTELGTMRYLAPEVCQPENKYDDTVDAQFESISHLIQTCSYDGKLVDYWSLGVIAFEIICGQHPFLGESPRYWLPLIDKQQSRGMIGITKMQKDGEVILATTSTFPCPTRLSFTLLQCLESWLPSMLEVDPTRRGKFHGKGEDSNALIALTRLQKIIHLPILHVRNFSRSLTYDVSPKTTVSSIKARIAEDLKIPEADQLILAPGGMSLCDNVLVHKYSQNTVGVFLLKRSNESFSTTFSMPKSLVTFLEEHGEIHEWKKSRPAVENQKLFADTIRFLETEILRVQTLAGCCRALLLHQRKACLDVASDFNAEWNRLQAVIKLEEDERELEEFYHPIPKVKSVEAIKAEGQDIFGSSQESLGKCQEIIHLNRFPIQILVDWYKKVLGLYTEFKAQCAQGSLTQPIPLLATFTCQFGKIRTSMVEDANRITPRLLERIRTDESRIIQLQKASKKLNGLKERLTTERLEGHKRILEMAFTKYPQHVQSPQPAMVKAEMRRAANVGSMGQCENEKTRDTPKAVSKTDITSPHPQPIHNTDTSASMCHDILKADLTSTHKQPTPNNVSSPSSSDDVFKANGPSPHPQQTNNTGCSPTDWDIFENCAGVLEAQAALLTRLINYGRNQSKAK